MREIIKVALGTKKVVLIREYSKIGYCYPRLIFKEQSDGKYVNLDLTTGFAYITSEDDFNEYIKEAQDGTEDDLKGLVNVDQFKRMILEV